MATVGKDGTGADESQGAECAVTEDLASGGEHTVLWSDDVLLNRTRETHVILLTNVIAINVI